MAPFARHQVIYTDDACDHKITKAGGCGFATFDPALGMWDATACSLGIQPSSLHCEYAGFLFALQHCVNSDLGSVVEEVEFRTDNTRVLESIRKAWVDGFLPRDRLCTKLVKKILDEIESLHRRGIAVSGSWVEAHAENEGNIMADRAAVAGRNATK